MRGIDVLTAVDVYTKGMVDVEKLAHSVLANSHLMSLATVDNGGPWVAVVNFYADEQFNIYWTSARQVRHSVAIGANPHVAASITFNLEDRAKNFGIQLSGVAGELPEGAFPFVKEYLKKFDYDKERLLEKSQLLNRVWYRLQPTKMELIYEAEFDGKKEVKLS